MKKTLVRFLSLVLALAMMIPLAACGGSESDPAETKPTVNPADMFHALLEQVQYDAEMADAGEFAFMSLPDLPETAMVTMYVGSGYVADELIWVSVAKQDDVEPAVNSLLAHKDQVLDQFRSYLPEEVDKIENYQLWQQDLHIIFCITNDYQTAKSIMEDPSKIQVDSVDQPTEDATQAPTEEVTEPTTEEPTEAPTEPPTQEPTKSPTVSVGVSDDWATGALNAEGYPELISHDQSFRDAGVSCVVDNMAFEYYNYSSSAAKYYAALVSKVATSLAGETDVYCLVIPTAIGIVFPDNLRQKYAGSIEDQGQRMEQIYGLMDSNVIAVNCYDKMMQHRDEYLYYRTDWHWNGIGAYYAYERFCEVKGVSPYTMNQRRMSAYEGYKGGLYTSSTSGALAATPDTVYAYHPYSDNVDMYFTDYNGNRYAWNVISNGDSYSSDSKYLIYAAGDQPIAEFYNADVTDGSVAIVVKESFGNALMSYVVDHYSTVYEIDYRHWSGDLVAFAREKGADDIIFANNIGMVRSDYLIGMMDRIIP